MDADRSDCPDVVIGTMEASAHILVVDDHKEIRDLLCRFLSSNGFRATAACNGAEMRCAVQTATVDLIILDLMLPGDAAFGGKDHQSYGKCLI